MQQGKSLIWKSGGYWWTDNEQAASQTVRYLTTHTRTYRIKHTHIVRRTDAQLFRCQHERKKNDEDCDSHLLVILKCLLYSSACEESAWLTCGWKHIISTLYCTLLYCAALCYTPYAPYLSFLFPTIQLYHQSPTIQNPSFNIRSESFLCFFNPSSFLFTPILLTMLFFVSHPMLIILIQMQHKQCFSEYSSSIISMNTASALQSLICHIIFCGSDFTNPRSIIVSCQSDLILIFESHCKAAIGM